MSARDAAAIAAMKQVSALISLALALIVVFTSQRQEAARKRTEGLVYRFRFLRAALFDVALGAATLAAVVVLAPLARDGWRLHDLGQRRGTLPSLFLVVWIGLAALVAWQLGILFQTLRPAWKTKGIAWRRPPSP